MVVYLIFVIVGVRVFYNYRIFYLLTRSSLFGAITTIAVVLGRRPAAPLVHEESLVLAREAGQGHLGDLNPLGGEGGVLGHELVHAAVAEPGVAVVVLGPRDGEGVAPVGPEQVAREAPFLTARDAAAYDRVHEQEYGVLALGVLLQVRHAIGHQGVRDPVGAPGALGVVYGDDSLFFLVWC